MTQPVPHLLQRGTTPAVSPKLHACAEVCPVALTPPAPRKLSREIIVCGRAYDIGWPVYHFRDNPRFSAYHPCGFQGRGGEPPDIHPFEPFKGLESSVLRYRERAAMVGRKHDLAILQQIIRQFVIHHDGMGSAQSCFHVLHDEKGLSVHFLIDNNGDIYQTLDLADFAFHASGVNSNSVGVELCNRGQVKLDPEFYRKLDQPRKQAEPIRIHGAWYEMWDYTAQQYEALAHLCSGLLRIFPNLPAVSPENNGPILTKIDKPQAFAGFLGHYHVTKDKWDPGCFNFASLLRDIRPQAIWFADVPSTASDAAETLVANNEHQAMGGYYPVGPCGTDLVFHGGTHLSLRQGAPVRVPFAGRVVAARFTEQLSPIGSCNFVLTRHSFRLATQRLVFYMLFFHLDPANPNGIPWLQRAEESKDGRWLAALRRGDIAFPDAGVVAGEALGQVGRAGPPGRLEPQIHVEVIAREPLGSLAKGEFDEKDCAESGLVCVEPAIQAVLGGLPPGELFRRGAQNEPLRRRAAALRKLAVRYRSEWAARSAREQDAALAKSRAWQQLSSQERDQIFCHQIAPTLWWTSEVAKRTGLPEEPLVWHYHPIEFVRWLSGTLRGMQARAEISSDPNSDIVTDGHEGNNAYFTADETDARPESQEGLSYEYEDLAQGYPPYWLDD